MRLGLNFVVTLLTLSLIFVFVGYLLGHYVAGMLWDWQRVRTELARQQEAWAPAPPPPPPPPPSLNLQGESGAATPFPPVLYRVQVGVFSEKVNAERLVAALKELGYEAISSSGPPYRVQTGAFSSLDNANRLAQELQDRGFEALVVR